MNEFAYMIWRFSIWTEGYGTYEDIDWAVKWHILRPLNHPVKTARIRRWIIRRFGPSAREKDEE